MASVAESTSAVILVSHLQQLLHVWSFLLTPLFLQRNGIEVSANDERDYDFMELPNGMHVLLVSDPTTDKVGLQHLLTAWASSIDRLHVHLQAAAAMAVHVGSNSDPEEIPGLAHFCEHMLFRAYFTRNLQRFNCVSISTRRPFCSWN